MWTLKHEISSPRLYELLIKTELKGDTALDLNNLYNHIKMSLNAVTRLKVELLPDYLSVKINYEFKECFVPDRNHTSYSYNIQVYNSLGHSLLVAMTNNTCVKSSMSPQAYKIVSTRAHEISGWNILSRLLHSSAPHLVGINSDVQSDPATLSFRNGEQLEDFHIILSGEIVSPTRLLIQ